jgi:hypothetical protein
MGSDSAEDCGFLRVIKICSTTSFGGETKPAVPYHKILWHITDPYSIKEILGKFMDISHQALVLCY